MKTVKIFPKERDRLATTGYKSGEKGDKKNINLGTGQIARTSSPSVYPIILGDKYQEFRGAINIEIVIRTIRTEGNEPDKLKTYSVPCNCCRKH